MGRRELLVTLGGVALARAAPLQAQRNAGFDHWVLSDMQVLIFCRHCDLVHIDEQQRRLDLLSLARH